MIFGQLFQLCKASNGYSKNNFRRNGTDDMIFGVDFAGEGSIDVGGPFREVLTNIVDELEGSNLPLLIATPNNRNNHGYNRDCFCLNPNSISPIHRELFTFMGYFLGFSIRTKSAMPWHFPAIFWKQLLEEPVTVADLEGLDAYSYQIIKDIEKQAKKIKPAEFDAIVMENFSTHLSDSSLVDLIPNGKETPVTHANHKEFIEKIIEVRLKETEKQMNWLRDGVSFVIDASILSFLTWEDVELRACGPKDIEIDTLKKISSYNVGVDHRVIKWFWEILEEYDQKLRQLYLKFVWGRSKIPSDTKDLRYKHVVNVYNHMPEDSLPQAHTCFFTLDVPEYKTKEIMKKRITTAIEMCGEIDTDYGAGGIRDEEGGGGGYGEEE